MQIVAQNSNVRVPTQSELSALMQVLDLNGDGVVQEDDFVAEMADWLDTGAAAHQEAVTTPEQRHQLHRRVSDFFLQFTVEANFASVRRNISTWTHQHLWTIDPHIAMDTTERGTFTQAQKQAAAARIDNADFQSMFCNHA